MKKKFLSFFLAVMMAISGFVMPAFASDENSEYTYDFEAVDARNYVDGQVIDIAALGEAKKAPTLTGNKSEYQVSTTFENFNGGADLNVYLSVKDGYLYVAFEAATQQRMQYDLGVAQDHRSDRVWNRARFVWNVNNSYTNQTPILYAPGTSSSIGNMNVLDSAHAFSDKAYTNGLQEAKLDLEFVYRFFAGTGVGQGIYQSPCVTLALYNVGTDTYYCNKLDSSVTVDSTRAVNYLPYTIIIPEKSFELICDKKGDVGPLGYDQRNAVKGQLASIPNYADKAPTLDGAIDANSEYSIHHVVDQDSNTAYDNIDTYYSVKDGYIYVGIKYPEANGARAYFYYGLSGQTENSHYSVLESVLNPLTNEVTHHNYTFRDPLNPGSKLIAANAFGGAGGAERGYAIVDMNGSNEGGYTTFELKISIAVMVSAYEDAGYETEAMNVFFIKLYPNLGSYLSYSTTGAGADKTYVMTQIREYTGVSISLGHAYPTVQLPKGCVEDYGAQGVDKLLGYGQKHVNAAPSEVKLDGVIGTSEYTGSFGFTKDDLRSGDGTLEPDVTYNISGTNYFAYDKDNLYFGAKVVDPNYVSGKSTYQLNIGVIDKNANTDIGAGLTRMSLYARVINGNSAVFAGGDKPGVTVRTQGYSSAVESAWAERTPTYAAGGYEIAGSYDAATKTITYEYKIPLSVLKAVFDVDTVDTLNIFSYITYNDATTGSNVGVWNMFKPLGEENGAVKALQNYTLSAYGISSLSYSNDKLIYGDIVHLVEADTKPGASIRLSDAKLSGIRFKSTYSDEFISKMKALANTRGETLEIGTLIAPAYYVEKAGAFTMEALDRLLVDTAYAKVVADIDVPFSSANGTKTYAGSLVNIYESNLARDFAGIGYIKIGDYVYYCDSYTVRNVSSVAKLALADLSDTESGSYKYAVDGKYSCYTDAQRDILNALSTDAVYEEAQIGAYKHVVIIGADGAGTFDTDTPNIDRIFANGGVSKNVITAQPTISAQSWASLLHGVTPDKHWSTNYDAGLYSYSRDLYPSVLKVLTTINPNYNVGSIVRWNSINVGIVEDNAGIMKVNSTSDANVTVDVCNYVKKDAPEFLFVQYNQADGAGENYGFTSTQYYDAIKWVDVEIGKIYDAYAESGLIDDTLFIVTADHGGLDKRHGGLSDVEKTIMVAALGSTIQKGVDLMEDMEIRDLAAVSLYALGYKNHNTWSARVPSGFFVGVEGGERPVFVDEYASRYHVSTATPALDGVNGLAKYIGDGISVDNYLTFDNTTADLMGNATTVSGDIIYVDGYYGSGADLSFGHVSTGDFKHCNDSFTIAFWFNTNGLSQDPAFISNKNWNSGKNKGFVISLALDSTGKAVMWTNVSDGSTRMDFRVDMPKDYMDGWVHAIVTFDREAGEIRACYDFDTNKIYASAMPEALKNSSFEGYSSTVNVGQDGTGIYGAKVQASIDDYIMLGGAFDNDDIKALAAYYGK